MSKDNEYIKELNNELNNEHGDNNSDRFYSSNASNNNPGFSGLNQQDEALAQQLGRMRLENIGMRSQMLVYQQLANGNFGNRATQMHKQFEDAMERYQKEMDADLSFWQSDFLSLPPSQD